MAEGRQWMDRETKLVLYLLVECLASVAHQTDRRCTEVVISRSVAQSPDNGAQFFFLSLVERFRS